MVIKMEQTNPLFSDNYVLIFNWTRYFIQIGGLDFKFFVCSKNSHKQYIFLEQILKFLRNATNMRRNPL